MYSTKTKKSSKNRLPRLLLLAIAAVLVIGGTAYALYGQKDTPVVQKPVDTTSTPQDDFANLDPGTEEDQAEADRKKDEATKNEDDQPPVGSDQVKPVVTFAGLRNGNVEVRSYVGEVYEATGTCTATFTFNNEKITKSVEGIKDATYTRCDRIVINPDEFSASGTWTLVVSYQSPSASGESESHEVSIP